MPKCIFQRHISPERYLITPFDQFLSSFPCCQFVTAFTLLFQLWTTGTVSTILHDSMDESVDCIFIVHIYKSTFKYIKLYILLISTLNLNCFNGTLLKCECGNEWEKKCTKAVVSIFNIHRDKNAIWKLIQPRNGMWTFKYIHLPGLIRIYLVTAVYEHRGTKTQKHILKF